MPKFPTMTSCFILDPIPGKLLHYFARTRSVEPHEPALTFGRSPW
jgi:hypothetical protein